jgi:tetratricopeptide (TPR) repeat protein
LDPSDAPPSAPQAPDTVEAGATLEAHVARAIADHGMGRLAEAEAGFRAVLALDPAHPEALHRLGVLALQSGRVAEAIELIGQAVAADGAVAAYHSNLGEALRAAGRHGEAVEQFRQALAHWPDFSEAKHGLEQALAALGDAPAPASARPVEAAPALPEREPSPSLPAPSLSAPAADVAALVAEGFALLARDELLEAAEHFHAALRQNPKLARAHLGLGRLLDARGKPLLAILHYQTATALDPNDAEAFARLGDAYMTQGKAKPALAAYDRALRADPRNPMAHYHEALTLLAQGSFARGWRGFEWRWRVPGAPGKPTALPSWDGKAQDGLRLLVHGEGGGVEEIFYAHALGDLLATGVRVFFRGDAGLAALLRRSFAGLELVPEGAALPPLDAAVPLGSLPGLFRRRKTDFRRAPDFLVADLRATTGWRERYRALGAGLKLGFAWRGTASWPGHGALHLPVRELLPLLDMPGTHGASLESDAASEREVIEAGLSLGQWPERGTDLDALAARIDAADLVIAVPGQAAALAGALGKPVFVLAPAVAGWPWLLKGRKLPWFPTMTVVRLRPGQPWSKAVAALAADLRAGIDESGPETGTAS